ncbi:response regulator [Falsihalocynthiibacter arcticus]|uniref:Two-component response regulator n=1 Tax=Falsihalocynthiibacter arcticus TaxID=1579316 RepID=A0A126V134_9RHOB|nr:response regulator [Falsihalocynthiibacter arcticus]AML52031.1 two-component response regulator [Falsihalocynthiibacter arcticus]
MSNTSNKSLTMSDLIGPHLPYLRRYARALTGSQTSGDIYAASTLEAVLADPSCFDAPRLGGKTALFRVFHILWSSSGQPIEDTAESLRAKAQSYLSRLTSNTREALLLSTVEGFNAKDIGAIMDVSEQEATSLIQLARDEMHQSVLGKIMIIEDEAIIAMDLESICSMMGHSVTGIARTRAAAVKLGQTEKPDLILADIQLADNSSGIDAVNDLLAELGDVPVVFITAFPERLLTGERPEPAFLIAKPYQPDQIVSAISQAMFFASTETLKSASD